MFLCDNFYTNTPKFFIQFRQEVWEVFSSRFFFCFDSPAYVGCVGSGRRVCGKKTKQIGMVILIYLYVLNFVLTSNQFLHVVVFLTDRAKKKHVKRAHTHVISSTKRMKFAFRYLLPNCWFNGIFFLSNVFDDFCPIHASSQSETSGLSVEPEIDLLVNQIHTNKNTQTHILQSLLCCG